MLYVITHVYTHTYIDAEIRLKREFGLRGQGSITWLKRRQFTVTRFLDWSRILAFIDNTTAAPPRLGRHPKSIHCKHSLRPSRSSHTSAPLAWPVPHFPPLAPIFPLIHPLLYSDNRCGSWGAWGGGVYRSHFRIMHHTHTLWLAMP